MHISNQGRFHQQVRFLRRQFLQDGDLPFTDVLSADVVLQALTTADVVWKERIYTPLVTLWVFLSQVLSQDHSCRAAVARLIAHRLARGQSSCSAETSAYCQAKKRLPEEFFADVVRKVGRTLDASAQSDWHWKDRRVYLFDGSTVSMPDTPENQNAYPQHDSQKPDLGFPFGASPPSFRFRAAQLSTWGSAVTQARGKARSPYSARCGTFFSPATWC